MFQLSTRDSEKLTSTLLTRYASDLAPDQKDALLDVTRATPHPQISPEVRRELVSAVSRGEPLRNNDHDMDVV